MYDPNAPLVSLEDIIKAREIITNSKDVVRTPMLKDVQTVFDIGDEVCLNLKLENTQVTGSYKIRGVLNQMLSLPSGCGTKGKQIMSMSAGNYGKAFAYMAKQMGLEGTILMPEDAPSTRAELIKSYGVSVERIPTECLLDAVDKKVKEDGMYFLHSFDDPKLIAGHASTGLEILEDVSDPDVILVCCGGGGLVAGVATAVKLSGRDNCLIYAVEPEGSRTMFESYKKGRAVAMPVKSVASGLSPPCAGSNTFRHCQQYVKDVLLVSDQEILDSMFFLHTKGLYVEPSGAAAFAALRHDKVPDVSGKKVVVVVTGSNVSPEELVHLKTMMN